MKSLFERMMPAAAYVLFVIAALLFIFTIIAGLSIVAMTGLTGIMTSIIAAFAASWMPFTAAAVLFRIDRLGRKQ